MDSKLTPYSTSRMNGLAWGLFLSLAVLFFLAKSDYAGVVLFIVLIGLAWLSLGCAVATVYLVLRNKSNLRHLFLATPVILITGLAASAWTFDFARMLLGYGD